MIAIDSLYQFSKTVFAHCGMPESQAETAARVLVEADLRGIDSHGVARLEGYVRLFDAGRANPAPDWKVVHETPSTATIDADNGLGLFVGQEAMKLAIAKAKQVGSGWVAVNHSNHFGIAAAHAMLALESDMIGMAMTNASPLVAPTNSKERLLGTNPICYVFPSRYTMPIVVDMATSAAANGKLEIAQRIGKPIPEGWVQQADGSSSTDPGALSKGGALIPLGGHKGYGMGSIVDLLAGVLSGANFGPWVPPFVAFLDPVKDQPGKGIGHFFGALRVDAFGAKETYFQHIQLWVDRFKNSAPIDPEIPVLIPGEPEFTEKAKRSVSGIVLNEKVILSLRELANRFGIESVI